MSHSTLYKYISRLMAVLLVLMLLTTGIPSVLADGESGTCGEGLSWSFSGGTLTITGSGAMENYPDFGDAPWYALRNEIYRLELPEGLTSIGNMAFYDCQKLTAVTIPNSVTRIGRFAFNYCTGLQVLDLGSGVKTISESAFSDCYKLTALQLPQGVESLGLKSFYRCEAITTVTVPSSVTTMDMMVFGYCKSLVSANIQARITVIPEWLFHGCKNLVSVILPDTTEEINEYVFDGCNQLATVYYNGTYQTPEEIQQTIDTSVPGFGQNGYVTDGAPTGTVTAGSHTSNGDGTATQEQTTVQQGQNSTVTSTITVTRPDGANAGGNYSTDITITVDGEDGWQEATDGLGGALDNYDNTVSGNEGIAGNVHVTVYVTNTETVDQNFVNSVAGQNVTVTIITQDGSVWQINGSDLQVPEEGASYDLRYEVKAGSQELCQELGATACYVLRFLTTAQINADVMIRLSTDLTLQNATLLQRNKELEQIQTTVVDKDGYAHFYLASVSEDTEYVIAINLPAPEQAAIVPESMQNLYGSIENFQPIQYEITGRESSWGMNIGQVTWIMVAVMVGSVVVVGFVIFLLNKRKLKMGYVPNMDDYEEF